MTSNINIPDVPPALAGHEFLHSIKYALEALLGQRRSVDRAITIEDLGGYGVTDVKTSLSVSLSANHAITSGTDTVVRFDTVDYDVNDNYDDSNYRVKINSSGKYLIIAQVTYSVVASGDRLRTKIRVNGSDVSWADNVVSSGVYHPLLTIRVPNLSVGDYIDVTAYNNNGTGDNVVGSSDLIQTYLIVQEL